MGNGQTAVAQKSDVFEMLAKDKGFKTQVEMALPHVGITADRLLRVVLTECRRTPKLFQCTPGSVLEAVMMCAETGLLPGPMGFCHIIPYGAEAQFQLGYKGLVALLWRSEKIKTIVAKVRHEDDKFEERIGEPPVWHPSSKADPGERIGCFATIGTTTDGWLTEDWPWAKVLRHRDQFSKAWKAYKDKSVWGTNPDIMAKKTLLIQVAKFAPISTEAMTAIAADEAADAGFSLSDMEMPRGPAKVVDVVPVGGAATDSDLGDTAEAAPDELPEDASAPAPDDNSGSGPKSRFLDLCEAHELDEAKALETVMEMSGVDEQSKLRAPHYQKALDNVPLFVALCRGEKTLDFEE